jgi:dTDP-4-amino-4,6-dideoxygalactose transaminase
MVEGDLAEWRVPLADVAVSAELLSAVEATVRSGWWSMGPRVAEFEAAFAEFCGARFALAVANGTAALHLALLTAECGPGDEVLVPSLNFVAAANTVAHTGATPTFCDIVGQGDLNIDPSDVEAAISPATKAIIVLHYAGFPCDLAALADLAKRRGVTLIEDAAHAPGSLWNGRSCGTIGEIGCFSFFSNKNLPVGEGGMVVTDDEGLADRLRLLRSHGMTTLTWDRHRGHASTYDVVLPGLNYRLDELRAAVGLVQLQRLPAENERRREIATRYADALHGTAGLELAFAEQLGDRSSAHHLAVALLPQSVSRDRVRATLATRRIQTSVHYPPIHQFAAYRSAASQRPLPQTEAVADRLLTLPLFGGMTDDQADEVVTGLLDAIADAS